tara:strand:+ start:3669 stop:4022 length:354 start_codon:yes stop_codon:yes gene_type:complete
MVKVKLMKIIPSKVKGKKWTAFFDLGEKDKKGKTKEKAVHFGQAGARDYTLLNDKTSKFYEKDKAKRDKVKAAYQARHSKDKINEPMTPGSLSYWVLWNKPTLAGSIAHFKNKFKLN